MSDFFLHTIWTPKQVEAAYKRNHDDWLQLQQRNREIEQADPLARRFDVGDFNPYQ